MLSRVFASHDKVALARLFNVHFRPITKCVSPIWNPTEQGLTTQLELVQRHFMRRFLGQRTFDYVAISYVSLKLCP